MTENFKPIFTITNRITAGLTRIERARGFLEAATLSEAWVREMLMKVGYGSAGTTIKVFDSSGPLFGDQEIRSALSDGEEDGLFKSLLLRG
jgi:hypothetical protein